MSKEKNMLKKIFFTIIFITIVLFFILFYAFLNSKKEIDNPYHTKYEKALQIENIEYKEENKKNDFTFVNWKLIDITKNHFVLEYQSWKTYTSVKTDEIWTLFENNNISVGNHILILYNEKKIPSSILKYDWKVYNEKVTFEQLQKLFDYSYSDYIELNSFNKKIIKKEKLIEIIQNQIVDESINLKDYNLPYHFYLENTNTNWLEKFQINEVNKVFISYLKLENNQIFIIFVKNNNLYKNNEIELFKQFNQEKYWIKDKNILNRLYQKYQMINSNLFF